MTLLTLVCTTLLAQAQTPAEPAVAAAPTATAFDSLVVDYETGPFGIFQNDGRYGPGGTAYKARDVGQQRNLVVAQRLSAEARIGAHTFIALWAPLDLTTRVSLRNPLTFQQTTFAAGTVVDHRYLFDGYRLSYLYRGLALSRFSLHVGASVQVRNASVEFRTVDASPGLFRVENDIGFVFALKVRARYDVGPAYAQLDADAINTFGIGLAGALHDVALTLGLPVSRSVDVFLRLRVVGGGAEVPRRDFENWGNFGAALAGVRVDLPALWPLRRATSSD